MSDAENAKEMVRADRAQPMSVDETGMFVTRNSQELWRVAKMLLATGAAPKSYREPEQVVVAIQALKSMGLNPYVSLRQTGMINGSFTVWGDLPLALVRAGGEMEWIEEFLFTLNDGQYVRQCFANGNCHEPVYGAVCRVKRINHPVHESVYTLHQAKQANLLGKPGPWTQYTDRMLRYRARSGALKDIFSDNLQGVAIKEYDIDGVERKDYVSAHKPQGQPNKVSVVPDMDMAEENKPQNEVNRVREKLEKLKEKKEKHRTKEQETNRVHDTDGGYLGDEKGMPMSSIVEHDTFVDPNADIPSPYGDAAHSMDESAIRKDREALEAALVAMKNKPTSELEDDDLRSGVG